MQGRVCQHVKEAWCVIFFYLPDSSIIGSIFCNITLCHFLSCTCSGNVKLEYILWEFVHDSSNWKTILVLYTILG